MIVHVWIQPRLRPHWSFIMRTLNSPRGWRRFYPKIQFRRIDVQSEADLCIRIKQSPFSGRRKGHDNINKYLNAYAPLERTIYINSLVWYGHSPFLKKVPLDAYRTYIINHETGHFLGKGHLNGLRKKWAPVMMQQTLGTFGSQYFNPYPTLDDIYA